MTAVNCIAAGPSGYFLTDSVATGNDPMVATNFCVKAIPIPHAQAVIAIRTTVGFQYAVWVMMVCGTLGSFDAITAEFATRWNIFLSHANAAGALTKEIVPPCEVIGMGWSESAGEVRTFIANAANGFVPEFHNLIAAPSICEAEVQMRDFRGGYTFIDPASDLLRIMQAQRARAKTAADPAMRGIIGGHAILTMVTKDEISQRVIHRWPDVVPEPIRPA